MAIGIENAQRRDIRMNSARQFDDYARKVGAVMPKGVVSKNQVAADIQAQKDAGLSVDISAYAGKVNPGTLAGFQEDASQYNTRLKTGGIRSAVLGSNKGLGVGSDSNGDGVATAMRPLYPDAQRRAMKGLDLLGRQNDLSKQMFNQDLLANPNSISSQLQRMYQTNLGSSPLGSIPSRDQGPSEASTFSSTGISTISPPRSGTSYSDIRRKAAGDSFGDEAAYLETGGRVPPPTGDDPLENALAKGPDTKLVMAEPGEGVAPPETVAAIEKRFGKPFDKIIESTTGRRPKSLRDAQDEVVYAEQGAVPQRGILDSERLRRQADQAAYDQAKETTRVVPAAHVAAPQQEAPLPDIVTRGGQAPQPASQPRSERVDRFTVGGDNDVYRRYDASGRVTGYSQSPDGNFGGTSIRRAQDEQRAYSQLAGQAAPGYMSFQGYREGLANLPQVRNRTWYNSDAEWQAAKDERNQAMLALTDQYKPMVSQRLNAEMADDALTRQMMLKQMETDQLVALQREQQATADAQYKRNHPFEDLENRMKAIELGYRLDDMPGQREDQLAARERGRVEKAATQADDLLFGLGAENSEREILAPFLARNEGFRKALAEGRTDDVQRMAASAFASKFAYDRDFWDIFGANTKVGDLNPMLDLFDDGVARTGGWSRFLAADPGMLGHYQIARGDDNEFASLVKGNMPAGLRAYVESIAKRPGSIRRAQKKLGGTSEATTGEF